MAQAGFHQINMIRNDIRDECTITKTKLANLLCSLDDKNMTSAKTSTVLSTVPSEASVSNRFSSVDNETANSMNENLTHYEMLKLLRTMYAEITNMNTIESRSTA